MSWLDAGIVGIIALSALVSVFRGFVREFIALATWIIALWLAFAYSGALAPLLPASMDEADLALGETQVTVRNLRVGIVFTLIVVLTLIVGAVLNYVIGRYLMRGSLNLADRGLGLIFGVVRGVIIVVVLVMAGGLTRFPETPWWQDSTLVDHFEAIAFRVIERLPDKYAEYFSFR
ncbi:MAG: CvpA family protein [Gammaproteobacteria bacterium]|jgi:membrane protein required for colicin V production|nr:CvpA family protein [Gammaproteobacteria bacterium]